MELAGSEEKIQALFRELKLEDERGAPEFGRVWTLAQATGQRPRRAFKISFAAVGFATAVLIFTLGFLASWSRNRQQGQQRNPVVAAQGPGQAPMPAPSGVTPAPKQFVLNDAHDRAEFNHRARKFTARRQAERAARNAAIREAVAISSWQSPTATLMQSPADNVLTSLPQLNRSATELNSFLANTPQ